MKFLYTYYNKFYYGPNVDDSNYLHFDEADIGMIFNAHDLVCPM